MATQARSAETQKDKTPKQKPQPAVIEADQAKPDLATDGGAAFSGGSLDMQAAMIGQAPDGVRRAMVGRIGQVQGNQHTQRLLASLHSRQKSELDGVAGEDAPAAETSATVEVQPGNPPAQEEADPTPQAEAAPAQTAAGPAVQEEAAPAAQEAAPALEEAAPAAKEEAAQSESGTAAQEEVAPPQEEAAPAMQGDRGGSLSSPPVVAADHVGGFLKSMAGMSPAEAPRVLAQAQTQITAQQAVESGRFVKTWSAAFDPAQVRIGFDGPKPAEEGGPESPSAEPQAPEGADAAPIEHAEATDPARAVQRPAVSTSAGPRPRVPLAGAADPLQVQSQRLDTFQAVDARRAEMDAAASLDVGADRLQPTNPPQGQQSVRGPSVAPNSSASTLRAPVGAAAPTMQEIPAQAQTQQREAPPTRTIPPQMRTTLDQAMAPKIAARAGELSMQHQQFRTDYEQQTQATYVEGQRQIAEATEKAQVEQDTIRAQAQTDVAGAQQEWQTENARVEAEHDARAATMETEVESQIQEIVQTHEQTSDATLTQAEGDAASTESAAETEADQVRQDAEAEAVAQEAAQEEGAAESVQQSDPMADAERIIAGIFDRMRQEVARIITEGQTQAGAEVAEGEDQVSLAIEALREQLRQELEAVFAEYPVLMLWAEMKIDEILDNAVESINVTMAAMDGSTASTSAFLQYVLPNILNNYQYQCLGLLQRAQTIQEGGLSAAETQTMVTDLVTSMSGADAEYVAEQTERIHDLLDGYGVDLTGETTNQTWGYAESLVILTAVDQLDNQMTATYQQWVQQQAQSAAQQAFGEYMGATRGSGNITYDEFIADYTAKYTNQKLNDPQGRTTFERVFGEIDFQRMSYDGVYNGNLYWADAIQYPTIRVYKNAFTPYGGGTFKAIQNAIHELGHGFDRQADDPRGDLGDRWNDNTDGAFPRRDPDNADQRGYAGNRWGWQQSAEQTTGEEFADMYLGWSYDEWETQDGELTDDGQMRSDWMNENMGEWIDSAINKP